MNTMDRATTRNQFQSVRKGFTLLELMIVIVIVAVLSVLAYPSFSRLILKHRAQDAASEVFTSLFKARSAALRRVDRVTMRPLSGTAWSGGWKIMDSSNNILDEHSQPLANVSASFSGGSPIVYTSTGRISSAAPTFTMTATNGNYTCTYTVEVDATGRPYETSFKDTNAAHTAGGGAPSC